MLYRVLVIAMNAYRENLRARILLGLAGIAFAASAYSLVVGAYTLRIASRVVADLGTAAMSVAGIAVAVLVAATSLHRELEQKTIFPVLARPVRRHEYLLGKFLGTFTTLLVFALADAGLVLLLTGVLAGIHPTWAVASFLGTASVAALSGWRVPSLRMAMPALWAAVVFVLGVWLSRHVGPDRAVVLGSTALFLLEVAVVLAIATLFASFSSPFLSALFTLGVFVVGRNADNLARLPEKTFGPWIHAAGQGLSKIVPNLQVFVPPRALFTGELADASLSGYLVSAAGLSLAWTTALMVISSWVFSRRDFL